MSSEEKIRNAEVLFSIRTRENTANSSENCSTNRETDGEADFQQNDDAPDAIMCVMWKNNRMGAAFYKKRDRQLYVVNDIMDQAPYFFVCRSLHRSVNPLHTITMGCMDEAFVKFMVDIRSPDEGVEAETATTSDAPRSIPPDLTLLRFKDYTFEACKRAVENIPLLSISAEASTTEKEMQLHSLVNFDAKLSVYALGALVKFLSANRLHFEDAEDLRFLHITQISLDNHVLIDQNTYKALQIFHSRDHEANSKKGLSNSTREGLSVYKIFSMHCKSRLGQKTMKYILSNPVNDPEVLNERLNLIGFSMQMNNKSFIENVHDSLKDLEDIHVVLSKIEHRRARVKNWEKLYKTMVRIVNVSESCASYRRSIPIFDQLYKEITPELLGLIDAIHNAIDFSSQRRIRPIIKFGLDEDLDAKKLRRLDIGKHLTAATDFTLNQLPHYFTECSVVYVPEMGHLVAIRAEPEVDGNELRDLGFQLMFAIKGEVYYKSPMCVELDAQLGEINLDIIAHENRIIERLSGYVLTYNRNIREPLRLLALIDCILAMSKVALLNGYVRPTINLDNIHEIKDGRHPLLDLFSSQYQSNAFNSGGPNAKVKILTGPNASGKSVYLKQVALIIFLAHIGSFVPATKANIGLVHSIHSRMHATESVTAKLSSFMIDLSQISAAVYGAKASSFVTIDEFGRGTTGSEGTAILAGALKKFLDQEEFCPHVLVATHLQHVLRYLPESPLVEALKMQHSVCEGKMVFTFQVAKGVATSYAMDMAEATGLQDDIVARAHDILEFSQGNNELAPLSDGESEENRVDDVLEILKPDD